MRSVIAHFSSPGLAIALPVAVLCVIGLACIWATERISAGPSINTGKQAMFNLAGVLLGWMLIRIGYQRIARYAYVLFGLGLLLLAPLLIAKLTGFEFGGLVPRKRDAYRWISLPGFQLQPSEFMKIAYVLALAQYLRFRENYRTLTGFAIPCVLSVVPMVLILKEPDLGTVLLMIPVLLGLLFAAGARKRHLALVVAAGVVVAPLMWERIAPYQRLRITGLLLQSESLREKIITHPEMYAHLCSKRQALEWERGSGWQLIGSKAALGSGGLLGEGWGQGTYVEYDFLLPDRHNDFVFALVGHQWGLLGCVIVLACYTVVIIAAAETAAQTVEPFGRLLAAGITVLFATQVVINVGMTVGLMPVTGMTLPFISYGGSSLLTSYAAAALLISVSRHRPFLLARKPFDYGLPPEATMRVAPPGEEQTEADERAEPDEPSPSPACVKANARINRV